MRRITIIAPTGEGKRGRWVTRSPVKARNQAQRLVGPHPKILRGGWAKDLMSGRTCRWEGCTYRELFPEPDNPGIQARRSFLVQHLIEMLDQHPGGLSIEDMRPADVDPWELSLVLLLLISRSLVERSHEQQPENETRYRLSDAVVA